MSRSCEIPLDLCWACGKWYETTGGSSSASKYIRRYNVDCWAWKGRRSRKVRVGLVARPRWLCGCSHCRPGAGHLIRQPGRRLLASADSATWPPQRVNHSPWSSRGLITLLGRISAHPRSVPYPFPSATPPPAPGISYPMKIHSTYKFHVDAYNGQPLSVGTRFRSLPDQ